MSLPKALYGCRGLSTSSASIRHWQRTERMGQKRWPRCLNSSGKMAFQIPGSPTPATIAAIAQKLGSPLAKGQSNGQASGPASGDLIVAIKQLWASSQRPDRCDQTTARSTTERRRYPNSGAWERSHNYAATGGRTILQKLNIGPKTTTSTSTQTQDQAAQLQKILDFVGGLVNPSGKSLPLGQVNGALGETIGNLLNGNKTAIGLIGSMLTGWLSSVPALPPGATASGMTGVSPDDSRVHSGS